MTRITTDAEFAPVSGASGRFLTPQLVCQVEEALARVAPFGEVRLVVQKGRLRFIEVVQSQTVEAPGAPSETHS